MRTTSERTGHDTRNVYDDLSSETKSKIKNCTSSEKLETLAKKENVELSLDQLDAAAGGRGWDSCMREGTHCPGASDGFAFS